MATTVTDRSVIFVLDDYISIRFILIRYKRQDSSACESVGVRYKSSEYLPINWHVKLDQANRTICFVAYTIIEPDVTRSVKKNGRMGNDGISTRYDNNSIIDVTITSRWQQRDEGAQGMSSPLQVKFSKVPITR